MKVTNRKVDKHTQVIEFDAVCPKCKERIEITDCDLVETDPKTVEVEVSCGCSTGALHLASKGADILRSEVHNSIEEFESLDGGCTCGVSNPPCSYCTHPGNLADGPEEYYL